MNRGVLALTAGLLAGCASGSTIRDDGVLAGTTWGVERIDEVPADHAAATLRFVSDSRVAGRAGCNQYAGAAHLGSRTLRISETLATRMACEPAIMQQETRFLTALGAVRTFRREGDRLLLIDDAEHVRVRLGPLY
jgi:heat shock protein HslJ